MRPLSPYLLFAVEKRSQIVATLGNNNVEGEVGLETTRRWNMLDMQMKKKYEAIFLKKKARYDYELVRKNVQLLETEKEESTEEFFSDDTDEDPDWDYRKELNLPPDESDISDIGDESGESHNAFEQKTFPVRDDLDSAAWINQSEEKSNEEEAESLGGQEFLRIPIQEIDLDTPIHIPGLANTDSYLNLSQTKVQEKKKRKNMKKKKKKVPEPSSEEDESEPNVFLSQNIDMLEGASPSDAGSDGKEGDDTHTALEEKRDESDSSDEGSRESESDGEANVNHNIRVEPSPVSATEQVIAALEASSDAGQREKHILRCKKCGQKFFNMKSHKKHEVKCEITVYKCSICETKFKSRRYLKVHVKKIHKEPKLSCNHIGCDERFQTKFKLKVHARIHNEDTKNTCDVCGTEFKNKNTLKVHVAKKHNKKAKDKKVWSCRVCPRTFKSDRGLRFHKQLHEDLEKQVSQDAFENSDEQELADDHDQTTLESDQVVEVADLDQVIILADDTKM